MIQAIEAREEAERIRQGYLPAPGTGTGTGSSGGGGSGRLVEGYAHASMPRSISGPASGPSTSRINTRPSFTPSAKSQPQSQSQFQPQGDAGSSAIESKGQEYSIPTSTSQNVPPPPPTVDPLRHDDPAELRRLAEEDTKRRIEQRGGEADLRETSGKVEGVNIGGGTAGGGGGLAPKRRGRK